MKIGSPCPKLGVHPLFKTARPILRGACLPGDLLGQVLKLDVASGSHHGKPTAQVLELSDVAGPRKPTGAQGEWAVEADDEGVRALFKDAEGDPVGFVLTGTKLSEKNALAKELPALMS